MKSSIALLATGLAVAAIAAGGSSAAGGGPATILLGGKGVISPSGKFATSR